MSNTGTVEAGACRTCTHWKPPPFDDWSLSIRLTRLPDEAAGDEYHWDSAHNERVRRAEQQYGQCQAIGLLDSDEAYEERALPPAFTQDASNYRAALYTRAEFGCTMHEAREDRPT
jgi:hypothetical protein